MFNRTPVEAQYDAANQDKLRILIVGAGIAGVTAAQMLRKAGLHPVLVERNQDDSHPGYMLALMPMVDGVFDDLQLRKVYQQRSVALESYGLHSHRGRMIRVDSMADMLDRYGDYRGIARGELLGVLTTEGCNVAFGATITGIDESAGGVQVTLASDDASRRLEFDLVIIAEGIHSSTRKLLLGERATGAVDTGWGGWVVWAPEDEHMNLGEELWGTDFFYGVYPVKGMLGVFLGGALEDTRRGPEKFVAAARKQLTSINWRTESCLDCVAEAHDPFFWPLEDRRSPQWAFDRTILLGDAAAAFLPTAGVGAGMAMESAWLLTRMLRYANKDNVATLLQAYEAAQRPRVEAAQDASRQLAQIMFRRSRLLAILRELVMRLVSVEVAIRPIQKLLASKPDPEQLAKEALARPTRPAGHGRIRSWG